MKRFLLAALTLILTVVIALPAMAVTLDYPPVLIETGEDGAAFSLTVEGLPEMFEVNKKGTPDFVAEYSYTIMFCDGNAFYNIGATHFKFPGEKTRNTPLFEEASSLSGGKEQERTELITDCRYERDGDTVTYFLEERVADQDGYTVEIDYENIIAFGYSITDEQYVYYRILVGGALEELTWEQYYDLLK